MDWNNYFMGIAHQVAKKSKDPSSQVGCVIVDQNNRPVSFGYNGWVQGCDEDLMTFSRPLKYHLITHSEMNAILFAQRDLSGCTLYSTHGPCDNCLKYILQAGINTIYYADPSPMKLRGSPDQVKAIIRLLRSTKAKCLNIINGEEYSYELVCKEQQDEVIHD